MYWVHRRVKCKFESFSSQISFGPMLAGRERFQCPHLHMQRVPLHILSRGDDEHEKEEEDRSRKVFSPCLVRVTSGVVLCLSSRGCDSSKHSYSHTSELLQEQKDGAGEAHLLTC